MYKIIDDSLDYLDVNELNNCNIVFSLKHINNETTHMEIDKNIILGIMAVNIPFLDHNQAPRNTY